MKIVLLGYMGSGKTTIGKAVSEQLDLQFFDLDELIIQREDKSISEIFDSRGAIYFRKLERSILLEMLGGDASFILALGGGTPCYFDNMQQITKATTNTFYLQASVPFLSKRLFSQKANRPLIATLETELQLQEFVGKHLFERIPFYTKAKNSISVEDKTIEEIAAEISRNLS